MKEVYVLTLKTPEFTAVRVFTNPAKALREASKTRNDYNAVVWLETKDGHKSATGTLKVTVKPVTLE